MKNNTINLIYYLLNPVLTEDLKNIIKQEEKKNLKEEHFSKKFNTYSYKLKTYDKVSTPFIDTNLFEDEQ